jgi:hypothetical protein
VTDQAPARPTGDDQKSLGFAPQQQMSLWLSPALLLHAALRVVISSVLGAYNDKREVMAALPIPPIGDYSTGGELWFDYVSDLGDGFDATYTMAWLLAQPHLTLDGEERSRGSFLVMGGDQCYPTASITGYEDKAKGPYRAALPYVEGEQPGLYALPGNHDWYDGLTSFMRVFCQGSSIGGWRTAQTRSYFALKLPHNWWLYGIDIQFDSYIDDAQRRYFLEIAKELSDGDAVILCSAKPSWVGGTDEDPETYAVLDYFERTVIRHAGATVRVSLSGDRHHYARYREQGGTGQKFTAGGGGAYLSPTHHLPASLLLPPQESRAIGKTTPPVTYSLATTFPDRPTSKRLGWGIFSLVYRTWLLAVLFGVLYAAIALAIGDRAAPGGRTFARHVQDAVDALRASSFLGLASGLVRSFPALLLCVLFLVSAVAFTKKSRTPKGFFVGLVHGVLHLLAAVLVLWVLLHAHGWNGWSVLVLAGALVLVGGVVGTELVAGYLLVADRWFGLNANELFAAQARPDYKNLLRLHIGTDGALTVYPVKVEKVPRRWDLVTGGAPTAPWFAPPDGALTYQLIEDPVTIPRVHSAATAGP